MTVKLPEKPGLGVELNIDASKFILSDMEVCLLPERSIIQLLTFQTNESFFFVEAED